MTAENGKSTIKKPWKPGQSGNPRGRRPGVTQEASTKAWIATLAGEFEPTTHRPFGRLFAEKLAKIALEASPCNAVRALEIIFDRLEPATKQDITINNISAEYAASLEALRQKMIEASKLSKRRNGDASLGM